MQILGIDVGGSGIKAALVETADGSLLTERIRIETPRPATPQAVVTARRTPGQWSAETTTGVTAEAGFTATAGSLWAAPRPGHP